MSTHRLVEQLREFYAREDVQLSFDMYHPTAADKEPEIDWSSMTNYQRTRADQLQFHLDRYEWEERK